MIEDTKFSTHITVKFSMKLEFSASLRYKMFSVYNFLTVTLWI